MGKILLLLHLCESREPLVKPVESFRIYTCITESRIWPFPWSKFLPQRQWARPLLPLAPFSLPALHTWEEGAKQLVIIKSVHIFVEKLNMQKTKAKRGFQQPKLVVFHISEKIWDANVHFCYFLQGKKFIPQPDLSICLHFQLSTMAVSDYQCLGNMMDGETQRKHLISKMIWDKILFLLPFVTQYGNMPDTSIMTWDWYPFKRILSYSMEMILVPGYPLLALMR